MKKVKYLLSLILIVIVFSVIGEVYVWHIESFEATYPYVTMYAQKGIPQEEMIEDIYETAKKNRVEVFTVDREVKSIFSTETIIYGTPGVGAYIQAHSDINQGDFRSIFLGDVLVEFRTLEDIEDISKMEVYQMIGDSDDITNFKVDLINKYAGKFPQPGYNDHEDLLIIISVWAVSLLLILLMTLYEVALLKKEVMVRIICGESLITIILKNILIDGGLYLLAFIVIGWSLSQVTTTHYCSFISLGAIFIFLILNSLVYGTLYFTDYKKDMGSNASSKNVLNFSYGYKVLSLVLVIASMAGCIELISSGIAYYQQRSFFEERKDYSYLMMKPKQEEEFVYMDIYHQLSQTGDVLSLINLESLSDQSTMADYLLGNKESLEYLKSQISDLRGMDFDEKVYVLIPNKYKGNQQVYAEVDELWDSYYTGDGDYEAMFYKDDSKVMGISHTGKVSTELLKNPVIIFNNIPADHQYWNQMFISNSSLFRITEETVEKIKSDYELDVCYRTNIYDYYLYQWQTIQRNMVIGIVLFIVLVILEGLIISTIISYEYRVNAVELSIMKVLGDGLFERHKKLWLTSFITGGIGLLISVVIFLIMGKALTYLLIGGTVMLLTEWGIMIYYIRKTDLVSVPKVLKGGAL